jgi:hypothetical protein
MAAAPVALSQNLRLGAIGGTALTHDYSPYFLPAGTITLPDGTIIPYRPESARTGSRSVIGGASLSWDFNQQFSLETNAIYRRLHLEGQIPTVTWEFPVLAKYRIPLRGVQPFLQGGPSFRTIGNLNTRPSRFGFSAGTGIDWETHGFRFSPTLRYTRWMSDPGSGIQTKQDQVEILLGVSHAAASNRHPLGRRVSIGVEGGFMLNPMARDSVFEYSEQFGSTVYQRTETTYLRSWIVGPHVDIRLTDHWSIIGAATYRQVRTRTNLHYTITDPNGDQRSGTGSFEGKTAILWQFPVLFKYRIGNYRIQPFVEAGPSFRLPQQIGAWLGEYGITAGAGVRMKWHGLNFEPGLRFTYWGPAGYRKGHTAPNPIYRNQLDSVLAITF